MAKKDNWDVKEEGLAARGVKSGVKTEMKTRQESKDRKSKCSCGAVHMGGSCPMC